MAKVMQASSHICFHARQSPNLVSCQDRDRETHYLDDWKAGAVCRVLLLNGYGNRDGFLGRDAGGVVDREPGNVFNSAIMKLSVISDMFRKKPLPPPNDPDEPESRWLGWIRS